MSMQSDLDFDYSSGLLVAFFVGIISLALSYLFGWSSSPRLVSDELSSNETRIKRKRSDGKVGKKSVAKKSKRSGSAATTATSDEDADSQRSNSSVNGDEEVGNAPNDDTRITSSSSGNESAEVVVVPPTTTSLKSRDIDDNQVPSSSSVSSSPSSSSKRSKRRPAKRRPIELQQIKVFDPSSLVGLGEVENGTSSLNVKRLQHEIDSLKCQLLDSENKFTASDAQCKSMQRDLERLQDQEVREKRNLDQLQQRCSSLAAKSRSLTADCTNKQSKVQQLERQVADLTSSLQRQLESANRCQQEAVCELTQLKEELTRAKLVNASGPSNDVFQAVSNENVRLSAHIEQLESDLGQIRQTNVLQQQELQTLRMENHKLHVENQNAVEEVRASRQSSQSDSSSSQRISAYENQIKHQQQELELGNQRFQECVVNLNETRLDLTRAVEREQQQAELVASLRFQFQELNADKQRVGDEANQIKASLESTVGQLTAQLANSNNELAQVKGDLEASRRAIDDRDKKTFDDDKTDDDELTEVKGKLHKAIEAERAMASEVDNHKATLVKTESILAKLQESVELEEANWRSTLTRMKREKSELADQLRDALTKSDQLASQLELAKAEQTAHDESPSQEESSTPRAQDDDNGSCNNQTLGDKTTGSALSTAQDMDDEFDLVVIEADFAGDDRQESVEELLTDAVQATSDCRSSQLPASPSNHPPQTEG